VYGQLEIKGCWSQRPVHNSGCTSHNQRSATFSQDFIQTLSDSFRLFQTLSQHNKLAIITKTIVITVYIVKHIVFNSTILNYTKSLQVIISCPYCYLISIKQVYKQVICISDHQSHCPL
jgi:hypothetical protein